MASNDTGRSLIFLSEQHISSWSAIRIILLTFDLVMNF